MMKHCKSEVFTHYEFYLPNTMGEPISYGGCGDLDTALARYNTLVAFEDEPDVIVIQKTSTVTRTEVTKSFIKTLRRKREVS